MVCWMSARSAVLAPGALSSADTGWQPASTMPAISVSANGTPRRSRRGCGLRSVIAVGLVVGVRRAKGLQPHAIGIDAGDGRIGRKVELVALGIDRLRYQRDVRQPRCIAMAKYPGALVRSE